MAEKTRAASIRVTRDRVVSAALAIVDRGGLERLTMRAIGRELGVDPMAAYHYFPNKQAILHAIADSILSGVGFPAPGAALSRQEALKAVARGYREALLAHPRALVAVSSHPIVDASGFATIERALALLTSSGIAPADALRAIDCVATFAVGAATIEAGAALGASPGESEPTEAFVELSPGDFPLLMQALSTTEEQELDSGARFERLLDIVIGGLEADPGRAEPQGGSESQ